MNRVSALGLAGALSAAAGCMTVAPNPPQAPVRACVDPGRQGNAAAVDPAISYDGRVAAFTSEASNLLNEDSNGQADVFVCYLNERALIRVSVSPSGAQASGASGSPAISAYGSFVAFMSSADNLVAGDTNGAADIFVRDLISNITTRASVSSTGAQANGDSRQPDISADGRFVAFASPASNLVPDDSNGQTDVFVRDLKLGTTERVSVSTGGIAGDSYSDQPQISENGRFVTFRSLARNLVAGTTQGRLRIYVRDRELGETTLVSVDSQGTDANGDSHGPSISPSGRFVAFQSSARNFVSGNTNEGQDVYLHDRREHTTVHVSRNPAGGPANEGSYRSSVTERYADVLVVYLSDASNLVAGDTNGATDVFLSTVLAGAVVRTVRLSLGPNGAQANNHAHFTPRLSWAGTTVVFATDASNLVSGDTNGVTDVFILRR